MHDYKLRNRVRISLLPYALIEIRKLFAVIEEFVCSLSNTYNQSCGNTCKRIRAGG